VIDVFFERNVESCEEADFNHLSEDDNDELENLFDVDFADLNSMIDQNPPDLKHDYKELIEK
ncbi:MAG: hypothetical protein MHPSP_004678, partial [Paramarteilia canceri]